MPMPITTVLLVISAIIVSLNGVVPVVIALTLSGLALANEFLRMVLTKAPSDGSYEIPAIPRERTVRNPITEETDAE